MPEFQMPGGHFRAFQELDAFTQGYVEAMFFADMPEDEEWSFEDLSVSALERVKTDCAQFQAENEAVLGLVYEGDYDETQAGRDFWFTRQGHGVGFWDRGLAQMGEDLSEAARAWGETWPGKGDDGLIYL